MGWKSKCAGRNMPQKRIYRMGNNPKMRNIAVILAGGSGHRLGGSVPKQLLLLRGKTILEWSVEAFERSPLIDGIAIVCRKDLRDRVVEIVERRHFAKVERILDGGNERSDSSLAAIRAYTDECHLIFHDAVRPLLSQDVISRCVAALGHCRALGTAIPATDTILEVSPEGLLHAIPRRERMRQAQTPQAFSRSVISAAYRNALADPAFRATDDCGVVARYLPDEPITIVEGDVRNIKITYPTDLAVAETLLRSGAGQGTN